MLRRGLEDWVRRRWLSPVAARGVLSELGQQNLRVYACGLGMHFAIKAVTPVLAPFKVGGLVLFFSGGNAFYAILPFAVPPLMRTCVTLSSWYAHRHRRVPHAQALLVGIFPFVGTSAFGVQIFASHRDISTFLIQDAAARIGRHLPVYGGADSRTEHWMMAQSLRLTRLLSRPPLATDRSHRPIDSPFREQLLTRLSIIGSGRIGSVFSPHQPRNALRDERVTQPPTAVRGISPHRIVREEPNGASSVHPDKQAATSDATDSSRRLADASSLLASGGYPLRLAVYSVITLILYQWVAAVIKRAGAAACAEGGPIETLQLTFVVVAATGFLSAAFWLKASKRYVWLAIGALLLYAAAREADVWFEAVFFEDAYKYLAGLPLAAVVLFAMLRGRRTFLADAWSLLYQPAATLFVVAAIHLCFVCQTLDRPGMWDFQDVSVAGSGAKLVFEESMELFAYLLLCCSGIETVLAAVVERRLAVAQQPVEVDGLDRLPLRTSQPESATPAWPDKVAG